MISIVIPLYNKAQSIANTIRCIQQQTYQDFEVVVIEGWSTDGSTELIHQLAEEDTNEQMKESIRTLLGINIVDRLESDLRRIDRKAQKENEQRYSYKR